MDTSREARQHALSWTERFCSWAVGEFAAAGRSGLTAYELLDRANAMIAAGRTDRKEPLAKGDISARVRDLILAGRIQRTIWPPLRRRNRAGNSCWIYVLTSLTDAGRAAAESVSSWHPLPGRVPESDERVETQGTLFPQGGHHGR